MEIKPVGLCFAWLLGVAAVLPVAQAAPPPVQMAPYQYGPIQARPPVVPALFTLTCRAQGTPVEFPNDIVLINNGPATVAAGTKVHWTMTAPAYQGDYTFAAPLAPTKGVFLNGVLGGGVAAGVPCTAKVVQ